MKVAAAATVGIAANPLAGKDVRRLTSGAVPVTDAVKIGAVRNAIVGAIEAGAQRVLVSGDRSGLGDRALAGLDDPSTAEVLPQHGWHTGRDTELVAEQFCALGAGAVIALGGDGTQRSIVKGWRDVPLIPLAVGTNNVFPLRLEATAVGFAAGAVASGRANAAAVTSQAKIIDVELAQRRCADVALVDVCLVRGSFVGARAVWDAESPGELIAAIAEPSCVGLSAIAAAVSPVGRTEDGGVHVRMACARGPAQRIRAAVAPGRYVDADIADCTRLPFGRSVTLRGPGVLALDGEREIVLDAGDAAHVTVNHDGPRVIDVAAAVAAAQRRLCNFEPASGSSEQG
ncbi:NAD(+)/NADH kinase [Candidatus Poriferisodalis sp.]|uniref:NAD(+)/NADH kinase n=1 Tax=Candidatus Poriferisodalis sp. TaxID=3101277 RepID=UPI003B016B5A